MYPVLKVSLHALLLQNKQWNPNQAPRNWHQDPDRSCEGLQEVVFMAVGLITETPINQPPFLARFMPKEHPVVVASLTATEAAFPVPPPVLCLLPDC